MAPGHFSEWLVRAWTKLDHSDPLRTPYLTPEQILLAVRNHWGVENDTYNSLDLQWREDSGRWCTHGSAVWSLGLLRIMAYNTAQMLRRRRLREKNPDGTWKAPDRWRSVFDTIRDAFKLDEEPARAG